jgi:hypothetical protein
MKDIKLFVLDCELSDGVNPCVCEDTNAILSSVWGWLKEAEPGDTVKIQCRTMTEMELRQLPDL